MTAFAFLEDAVRCPAPADAEQVALGWEALEKAVERAGDEETTARLDRVKSDSKAKSLFDAVFGNSPYLKRLLTRRPAAALALLDAPADAAMADILTAVWRDMAAAATPAEAKDVLRRQKQQAALLIAFADLTGLWSLEEVTGALSTFADTCLNAALRFELAAEAAKGKCTLPPGDNPEESCGIALFAMGKYGARELNYSSDIDVVVFFDPARVPVEDPSFAQPFAIKLTKGLVNFMADVTGEGYVFRTDLRLRPDASATPVALSVDAAAFYYETMGQNWERAAWIKARACAGDKAVGAAFLNDLKPYIWRRYLDYAAIEDIHSIKRQIHAEKGHAVIAIEGHNIKLGRGGIREIEFFAQTQQLIGGGRDPNLRNQTTLGALAGLEAAGIVRPDVRIDMTAAYRFLREVEHRLQMVADEQTHSLPRTAQEVDAIATFCGFDDPADFRQTLRTHLTHVQDHYAELFEEEPSLGAAHGNLVFTGVEDDPGTLETLEGMGFKRASQATQIVRGWHHGRYRVMRSERARALLTKLVPHLLEAFSRTEDPDAAMTNFDRFLTGLPSGVQLFSMLHSHPELIVLLADILGTAPKLAKTLANNSGVLDVLLDPDFYHALPFGQDLTDEFTEALGGLEFFEDVLDAARIWASEMRFRAGVNLLTGHMEASALGPFFADLADAIITGLVPVVLRDIEARFGTLAGDFAIIALGKLGSREMSATSDLDIIFVYDTEDPEVQSEGPKVLFNTQYYARLSQRLISALTAPTAEGQMFEIDTRLRPSGNSGPIAIRFEGFDRYQKEEAWTWEKMALTRARVIAGSKALAARIEKTRQEVLTTPRDRQSVLTDVADMRRRIFAENSTTNPWDLKHVRGGLVDVEFIAQGLQLIHAPKTPSVLAQNTREALANLEKVGALAPDMAKDLLEASALLHNLTQITRVCVDGPLDPDAASQNLRTLVARAGGEETFAAVEAKLVAAEARVLAHFEVLFGQTG